MFTDNKDFYPTPTELTKKLVDMIPKKDLLEVNYILEPSAGKGDLIEGFKEQYKEKCYAGISKRYWDDTELNKLKIDCIEIDESLKAILRNKGYNLIASDFLTFNPVRFYDLIIANFPFSNGCKHLLKAINIQERIGGKILCIINAETINNTFSNERKQLAELLKKYNAQVQFIKDAFTKAERKTNVEVALVYVDIPMKNKESIFYKKFKSDNKNIEFESFQGLLPKMNKLERLIFEYNMVIDSTVELFKEQLRINDMLSKLGLQNNICIANGGEKYCKHDMIDINDFVNETNMSFWNKFINETDLKNRLPSKLRYKFTDFLQKQKNVSFTLENLQYFYEHLLDMIPEEYEKTVANIFDVFTRKYNYSDREWNKNIHMYNGWKTNNAYKIGSKVIFPCYHSSGYFYSLPDELVDLNIIFENISGKKYDIANKDIVKAIENNEKNIDTEFFLIDSYKKGTVHIKFKNMEYVKVFNILAAKGKMWLPSDFGKKKYEDMTDKEKELVKVFFKPEEYNVQMLNQKDLLKLM